MKKIMYATLFTALFLGCYSVKAQLSSSELARLKPLQKSIYEQQSDDIRTAIVAAQKALLKAEDLIKLGQEMKGDNAQAAGAVHIARGIALKEKALKALEEAKNQQVLLDHAAREAIKNNEREAIQNNEKEQSNN